MRVEESHQEQREREPHVTPSIRKVKEKDPELRRHKDPLRPGTAKEAL